MFGKKREDNLSGKVAGKKGIADASVIKSCFMTGRKMDE